MIFLISENGKTLPKENIEQVLKLSEGLVDVQQLLALLANNLNKESIAVTILGITVDIPLTQVCQFLYNYCVYKAKRAEQLTEELHLD